jgi:hypothetical protein
VRLVDDEQPDARFAHRLEEAGGREALGRDVQQAQLARRGARQRRAVRRRILLGVDERGAARGRARQRLDLVLHERDKWRDDEREVVAHERGKLVAERLARARGHHDEQVALGPRAADGGDRLGLAGAEVLEAEVLAQGAARILHSGDRP